MPNPKPTQRTTSARVKLLADYVHCRLRLLNGDCELRAARDTGAMSPKIIAMTWQCANELDHAGAANIHDAVDPAIHELCSRYGVEA